VIAELASVSFPALGTTAALCVAESEALPAAHAELDRELELLDAACSRFRDDSELSRLNAAAGTGPVLVGPLLLEAVSAALDAAAATDGLVDPTVGHTLRLAGYDRRFVEVKLRDGQSFRASFATVPGWEGVELDRPAGTVSLAEGVELDLGATAKALGADRAARAATLASGSGVLVSLGGDIAVAGPAPDGGWPVLIAEDHAAPLDGPGPKVALVAGGLATSGTAVRRWQAGEATLHHIVDPRTGRPAETPWRTVSVCGASCVHANAASTAAIVLGEEAPAWLEARGLPARLVRDSGEVVHVGAWPEEGG